MRITEPPSEDASPDVIDMQNWRNRHKEDYIDPNEHSNAVLIDSFLRQLIHPAYAHRMDELINLRLGVLQYSNPTSDDEFAKHAAMQMLLTDFEGLPFDEKAKLVAKDWILEALTRLVYGLKESHSDNSASLRDALRALIELRSYMVHHESLKNENIAQWQRIVHVLGKQSVQAITT